MAKAKREPEQDQADVVAEHVEVTEVGGQAVALENGNLAIVGNEATNPVKVIAQADELGTGDQDVARVDLPVHASADVADDIKPDLSPEEIDQILNDARTQRRRDAEQAQALKDSDDALRAQGTHPDQRRENPGQFVGLDHAENGDYAFRKLEHGNARVLLVDKQNYEHVDTDADGVWLYRAM